MNQARTARPLFLAALMTALLSATGLKGAEYRLQAGDVIEVSVAGIPELRQRVPVQLDGTITFPVLGTLPAEGAPFSDLRSRIQAIAATKIFRLRTPDGRELQRMFDPEEVTASIVDYRPVFVSGHVARPGEQGFRPRMTVREAVAFAGGFPEIRRADAPLYDTANLRSEYVGIWLNVAREQARIWRIRTDLGDKLEFDPASVPPSPVSDGAVSEILNREMEYRAVQRLDHDRAKEFYRKGLQLADEQIKYLSEQQQKEEQGVLADTQELQRITELVSRGTLTTPRLTDARRDLLLSSTRQLQTNAQLMQVKRQRAELAREVEKIDDQRRVRLLAELQEAGLKLAGERARLQSADEKLRLLGMRVPGVSEGSGKVDYIVFRRGASGRERLIVDPETELEPGDVVEVRPGAEQTALR
jgi:polysaccharide export outer membrane protein